MIPLIKTYSILAASLLTLSVASASNVQVMNWTTGDQSGTTPSCQGSDVQYGIDHKVDGGRSFTGSVAAGDVIVTNTSSTFTTADIGKIITGSGINSGWAVLVSLSDSTHAVMTVAATSSFSGTLYLGGDTLVLAAGTPTWSSPVTLAAGKSLQIVGAGVDLTTINANAGAFSVSVNPSVANTFFLSGMTINRAAAGSQTLVNIGCTNAAGYPIPQFRVTNVKFNGTYGGVNERCFNAGASYGVVDNCTFNFTGAGGQMVNSGWDNTLSQSNNYHTPQSYGDTNTVVFEDCHFTSPDGNVIIDGVFDGYNGAKTCFRNNIIRNGGGEGFHGLDSASRSFRQFEYYNNTMTCSVGLPGKYAMRIRGGTGMFWGNTFTNDSGQTIGSGIIGLALFAYYGANTPAGNSGNMDLNSRAATGIYYPKPDVNNQWGTTWQGVNGPLSDGLGNKIVFTAQDFDCNYRPRGDWDSSLSRSVNNLTTTIDSTTVSSSTANFSYAPNGVLADGTDADNAKLFVTNNFPYPQGVLFTDGATNGTTFTSNSITFSNTFIGRYIGDFGKTAINSAVTIAAVINSHSVTMSQAANKNLTGLKGMVEGVYITGVSNCLNGTTNCTTATLNCRASASGAGNQTLTIGYYDQGYPLLDQPGYGSFPSQNLGDWPNAVSYSTANFEALDPVYFWNNTLDSDNYPVPSVERYGAKAYIKPNSEYYYQMSSFHGTAGVGVGVSPPQPNTGLTKGVGYWATDTNTLYVAADSTTWVVKYKPLIHPHPFVSNMTSLVTTNLLARYQADSLSLNDGANISTVTDTSGNGNTLTGAGSVVFKTNIINGKPVMRFDGTANSKFTLTGVTVGTNHTFFVVASESSQASFAGLFGSSGNNGIYLTNGKFNYYYNGSHLANTLLANNTFHILEGVCSSGTLTYYLDGNADGTASSFPGFTATRIGNTLVGDIAEILDYGTLSTSDRSTVRQYLGSKYGIAVTP